MTRGKRCRARGLNASKLGAGTMFLPETRALRRLSVATAQRGDANVVVGGPPRAHVRSWTPHRAALPTCRRSRQLYVNASLPTPPACLAETDEFRKVYAGDGYWRSVGGEVEGSGEALAHTAWVHLAAWMRPPNAQGLVRGRGSAGATATGSWPRFALHPRKTPPAFTSPRLWMDARRPPGRMAGLPYW